MPLSFNFTEIQPEINTDTLIITPNARTQQAILNGQMFAHSCGEVYQPANVLSFPQWLDKLWDELAFAQSTPQSISSLAVKTWFEEAIELESDWTLTNPSGVASKAVEAYKNLVEWNLVSAGVASPTSKSVQDSLEFVDFESNGFTFDSIETDYFIKWTTQFREYCQSKNLIPDFCRLAFLAELNNRAEIDFPEKILLTSFDHVTPLLKSYLVQLQANKVEVVEFSFSPNKGASKVSSQRIDFSSLAEEVEFAANYSLAFVKRMAIRKEAVKQNVHNPVLAVVVENLQENLAIVHQYFSEVFHPKESKPWVSITKPNYNVSAGSPLAEQPVIAAAIKVLGLGSYRISREEINFLKNSPFIEWGTTTSTSVEQVTQIKYFLNAIYLRPQKHFSIANLIKEILAGDSVTSLSPLLEKLEFLKEKKDRSMEISMYSDCWQRQLSIFGWLGSVQVQGGFKNSLCKRLNEFESKACLQFYEALNEIDEFSLLKPKSREEKVYRFFRRLLLSKTFQIASDHSSVQVLGMLEAAGLRFDELLIIGFNSCNWPQKQQSNPFIPLQYQRDKNMPGCSPDREYEYAEKLSMSLLESASSTIVCSSGELSSNGAEASFFSHLPVGSHEQVLQHCSFKPNEIIEQQKQAFLNYEWVEDCYQKLPSSKLFGGTYLLSDYAKCPFYSLLKHQFKLPVYSDSEPGIDPREKGTWLHDAMEEIWRRVESYDRLSSLSKSELESIVNEALDTTLESRKKQLVTDGNKEIIGIEKAKLLSQILQWMSIELERAPFDEILLEKEYQLDLESVTLNFRIDRINIVNNKTTQSIEIIDYKTGKVKLSNWLSVRPTEAQMPAYVLAISNASITNGHEKKPSASLQNTMQTISMLGYAFFRTEDISLQGFEFIESPSEQSVSKFGHTINGKKRLREAQLKVNSLSELKKEWHSSLSRIAHAVKDGWMPVSPKDESVCAYCDYKSICRINEQQPETISIKGDS